MLGVKEIAAELGVSAKTVYALVANQSIPFYRVGTGRGTIRFDLDEVKRSLKPKPQPGILPMRSGKRHLS